MLTPEVIITLVFCIAVTLFGIFDLTRTLWKLHKAAKESTYQPQPSASVIREESGWNTVVIKNIDNEDADELLRRFREAREQRKLREQREMNISPEHS